MQSAMGRIGWRARLTGPEGLRASRLGAVIASMSRRRGAGLAGRSDCEHEPTQGRWTGWRVDGSLRGKRKEERYGKAGADWLAAEPELFTRNS